MRRAAQGLVLGLLTFLLSGCFGLALVSEAVVEGREVPEAPERELSLGMSEAEVEAILGVPEHREATREEVITRYREVRRLRGCRPYLGPFPVARLARRTTELDLTFVEGRLASAWMSIRESGRGVRRNLFPLSSSDSVSAAAPAGPRRPAEPEATGDTGPSSW